MNIQSYHKLHKNKIGYFPKGYPYVDVSTECKCFKWLEREIPLDYLWFCDSKNTDKLRIYFTDIEYAILFCIQFGGNLKKPG